jgi:hypothetical protein
MISNIVVRGAVECAGARDVIALAGDCWGRMNTSLLHLYKCTRCVCGRVCIPVAGADTRVHAARSRIAVVWRGCVDEEVRPAAARHACAVHMDGHSETG